MSGASTASRPTVIVADPRTDPRWATLAASAQGSLFTSPPWIRSVCGTYGFAPQARIVTDAAGHPTDGFAWVPISDIRGDRLVSLPFSDRAEPVVADPVMWSSLVDDALCTDIPLTIRCLDGAAPTADARLVRVDEAAWHGTPLGAPIAEIYASLKSAARRNIATADRNGVHVEALTGLAAIHAYHRLHMSLRKYKYRLLAQPLAFFERIWEEFSVRDGIVVLLAYVNGVAVAGGLYLIWNDALYYKFGASLANSLPLRPNDAIAWAALRWASERGLRLLDWGLSDLDQPGLIAYKRKWASDERRIVTLCSTRRDPNSDQGSGELLDELTRLLTDHSVPDHVTERAGSILYRYFDASEMAPHAPNAVSRSHEPSPVYVHPYGLCESGQVGAGTRIWAFAHVLAGAELGRDCNICDHAYVEGGVTIGDRVTVKNGVLLFDGLALEDDVFLGPAVVFTNDLRPRAAIKRGSDELLPTRVQTGATLGAGVVVICGVTIGAHAFIGAGAVVTKDVPAYGLVVGNPGRLIGWACECGNKLAADLACVCGRSYKQKSTGLLRIG